MISRPAQAEGCEVGARAPQCMLKRAALAVMGMLRDRGVTLRSECFLSRVKFPGSFVPAHERLACAERYKPLSLSLLL